MHSRRVAEGIELVDDVLQNEQNRNLKTQVHHLLPVRQDRSSEMPITIRNEYKSISYDFLFHVNQKVIS